MTACSQTRSFSLQKILLTFALLLGIAGLLGLTAQSAHAQIVAQTTTAPPTTIAPAPAPIGLNVSGASWGSGIGQAYNVGGDPTKSASQVLSDTAIKLGVDASLAGNTNPNCVADCRDTLAKGYIIGEQLTAARSMNQGNGTQQTPVIAVSGVQSAFGAGFRINWNANAPLSAPAPTGN